MIADSRTLVRQDAEDAQKAQSRDAKAQLYQFGSAIAWPWQTMTDTLGPIQRGTVHYLCAPSGNGKTTMAGSLVLDWLNKGVTVVMGGFERDPGSLRRLLAAMSLGLNPGDVLGGEWEHHDDFSHKLAAMEERVGEMIEGRAPWDALHLIEDDHVSLRAIDNIGNIARAHDGSGSSVICIVDHIDHLGPDGSKGWGASSDAVYAIHAHAKKYNTRWLAFSQMNNREGGKTGDKFWRHRSIPFGAVSNGQTKEQTAWTMTGLYRPLRPDVTGDDLKAVAEDRKALTDVLWSGVTAMNVMKHRDHGERVGTKMLLGWEHGKIVDAPQSVKLAVEAKVHGIHTSRGF